MKEASSESSIRIERSTLRMSAQLLPLFICRHLSDALFTAPLLSHQTVIAGRVKISPALDSASSMTLIAHSPNSSPLYDPADDDSSENEPASHSPVVLSISIQPAHIQRHSSMCHMIRLLLQLSFQPVVSRSSRRRQSHVLSRGRSFPTSNHPPTP